MLAQALAKGGRDEQAIETATELGVDEVIAWQAERSIVRWSGKETKALAKWTGVVRAAGAVAARDAADGLRPGVERRFGRPGRRMRARAGPP